VSDPVPLTGGQGIFKYKEGKFFTPLFSPSTFNEYRLNPVNGKYSACPKETSGTLGIGVFNKKTTGCNGLANVHLEFRGDNKPTATK